MMGFGFGGMGWLAMLVFWGVIITLAVWVLGKLFPRVADTPPSQSASRHNATPESPLEILEQRYARGKLSRSEYEAMHRDLQA